MKPCNKCGAVKPLEEFSKDRRNKDGRAGICQPCRSKRDWRNTFSDAERTASKQGPPDLNVLSLGAGVQSSTVLMMAIEGEIPALDMAIFADTGWEPDEVYEHLFWLQGQAENAGIPLHVVENGNIHDDMLAGDVSMPLFVDSGKDAPGQLRRQCTKNYKIDPVRKQLVNLIDRNWHSVIVDQWFGISWDEIGRMSESFNSWTRFRYPLIERRMTRQDCIDWMTSHRYPEPPRSACVVCPYRSESEWARVQAGPHWQQAVDFDNRLRDGSVDTKVDGPVFLHRSMRPLSQLTFKSTPGEEATSGCGAYCAT